MKAPRVTLEQWRALQTVVDEGGFAQAAEVLHRSQSSVSYAIKRLEEQLGIPVLEIVGRKAVLTEAGHTLLQRSRNLTDQASLLENLAQQIEQGWEPEINLVADAAYPTERLANALKAFLAFSHGSRVQLREEVLSGVEEQLLAGNADLAISGLQITGYLAKELGSIEFIAVAHPEHALHQHQHLLSQDDLKSELQVVTRDSGARHPRDAGWLGAEQRWTVANLATAAELVASGLGFAWLPTHEIRHFMVDGRLKPLSLVQGGRRNHMMYLYVGQEKPQGPASKILADLISQHALQRPLTS
ncbi:LysR family transcriptional regulator [Halopseudomonas salegens]|uniref:Transcriptional regulator, LysR family n=1 Tax=Halopseudomonas salegens TaxID=1434072 RepID=A0A1H2FJT3_9GAMM|nr:LysR family transcriptional regulator [Halopseudomonas salegens]SDU07539.1 transcriptional regulator, LysR family [Halopseudomonas salegens]